MIVLGLTGGFHFGSNDAAATLIINGEVVGSIEEERLSRVKNSFSIPPTRCIKSVLDMANITMEDVDAVTLYIRSWEEAESEMRDHLISLFGFCPPIEMIDHHQCHAASSYYASDLETATIVTFDWSGDGVSSSIWLGDNNQLKLIESIKKPNSLGIFYAAFTQLIGFERGDEYKVMGLASYGSPNVCLDSVLNISQPIYQLNPEILKKNYRNMQQITYSNLLRQLFTNYWRPRYGKLEQRHMDLAASVQKYFEIAAKNLVEYAVKKTGVKDVCLAGGGALNCTSNGKLLQNLNLRSIYVPPFPNDSGCSFGGAAIHSIKKGQTIKPLQTAQLGPAFSDEQIYKDLELLKCGGIYSRNIEEEVAEEICSGKLVGWFQGGLEVGPRALGGRSILADPRTRDVKDRINKYVKFRETFRPFAPSVTEEKSSEFFNLNQKSPYMSFITEVKNPEVLQGITHIDGTARVQTVPSSLEKYYKLIEAIRYKSGFPVVLNTSFNYMGQPIVCTPKEAIYTFFGTGLDTLALGNYLLKKR